MKRYIARILYCTKEVEKHESGEAMSGIDRYEWYEMDVKDYRHRFIFLGEYLGSC